MPKFFAQAPHTATRIGSVSFASWVALLASACSSGTPSAPDGSALDGGALDGAGQSVTYHAQVEPILAARCNSCHTQGGIAPFVLTNYASAAGVAARMRQAVDTRQMPPWGATNDGSCQTYRDARWLSADEIATIDRWVEAGAPEGIAPATPPQHDPPAALDGTIVSVRMAAPYAPAPPADSPEDDYRCFLLDPGLDHDQFVTGYDVTAGDPTIVHHVLVFSVDPAQVVGQHNGQPVTNEMVMNGLAQAQPGRAGWSCFGAAGEGVSPSGLPVSWAPGTPATRYPAGTGLSLRRSDRLVMQVHYHFGGTARGTDQTAVRLQLQDRVDRRAYVLLPDPFLNTAFSPTPASLPPRQASTSYTWRVPVTEALRQVGHANATGLRMYGVFPHMHQTGHQMHAAIESPASAETCAAEVPDWNFHWQQFYFYQTPMALDAASTLRVTCDYNTTGRDAPTLPGFGSNNEMCLLGVYVVPEGD